MKKFSAQLTFFAICLLLGFLVTLQLRSVKVNSQTVSGSELMRASELQEMLTKEKDKNAALYSELLNYQEELSKFRQDASSSGEYAQVLVKQLERTEILAGLSTVTGPGVTVTMKDSELAGGLNVPVANYVIHDADILLVVNELRNAGAEAIAINGERLLATSEIRCVGSVVNVNDNRYAPPYVITAIGDSATLENALKMRDGVIDQLTPWGISVAVEKNDNLKIDAYGGAIKFKYATPVTKTK